MNHIIAAAKWHRLIILGLMLIIHYLCIALLFRFFVNITYSQVGKF